ncbi:peptidylprolyl isomerase [Paraburkholderia caribensis]|uniref:peptidylprolyl isomerase n=2 Tax=Paraburkholderia TaxID=1822464 RepID=B2JXG0_PARP8|nr:MULTISPECIES: peptidylprolyl isomerase [Paraburkholderia]ACC76318.1 PpiC-type peptidyl-prolyl cis-trans isomerase [Paraburkholderia phymatum STM815]MCO4881776.1 peptidyl-prolyl cis-trans isomerase [Paraburkholderia caribensis]PTB24167.1 peptidyl-prolyl cis-trans isomerase [Paraburkholderia caribensis]
MKFQHWTTFAAATALYLGLTAPVPAQTASAPAASLPAGTVAIINGVSIPQAQLDAAVQATRQPDTPQLRQALKAQLITRELFRQNAEKAGYGNKPEVQQVINATKVNAESQLYLKDNIHPDAVTDAQVKSRYDEIVASLGKDDYRPRIIAVADAMTAATVLGGLKAGKSFDVLARQYSITPDKANGGELPWVSFKAPAAEGKTSGLPLPVAQALTQLPVGGVTPEPVIVGNARVIVKLDAKRPTQVPKFDQVKDTIRQQLQALALEKASAQFTAGLLKNATIQQ